MKHKLGVISEEVFTYSLITYLILLLAETVKEGFVSYFFNINWVLVVVLISGVVMALTPHKKEAAEKPKKITGSMLQNSFLLSIGSMLLVYYKTQELGNVALLISLLSGVIVMFLSILILTDTPDSEK